MHEGWHTFRGGSLDRTVDWWRVTTNLFGLDSIAFISLWLVLHKFEFRTCISINNLCGLQIRGLFITNSEPSSFIQYCCPWLLPALILSGNITDLKWASSMVRRFNFSALYLVVLLLCLWVLLDYNLSSLNYNKAQIFVLEVNLKGKGSASSF